MKLIINSTSMVPIYEQIVEQIRTRILQGELLPDTMLPSVRSLASELKITVHGKGTFVNTMDPGRVLEERRREVEADLEMAIRKGRSCSLSDEELKQMFDLLLEE